MNDNASGVVGGNNQTNQPDYGSVEIPSKNPSEMTYVERRADLLEQIMSLGHPSLLHQGECAQRYGVSQSQISKDISRLGEYIDSKLGDRRGLVMESVFDRCITGLLEQGEYRDAARTAKDYDEWLTERTDLRQLADQVDRLEREANR